MLIVSPIMTFVKNVTLILPSSRYTFTCRAARRACRTRQGPDGAAAGQDGGTALRPRRRQQPASAPDRAAGGVGARHGGPVATEPKVRFRLETRPSCETRGTAHDPERSFGVLDELGGREDRCAREIMAAAPSAEFA
jgi:hypothetical protein